MAGRTTITQRNALNGGNWGAKLEGRYILWTD